VLVVEVDVIDSQPLQRRLAGGVNVLGTAVDGSPGAILMPNLVARKTSSRRPAIAAPTSTSLVWGPYMSEVSRNVQPSSSARAIVAVDSSSSPGP
jgi:hypothetical protein